MKKGLIIIGIAGLLVAIALVVKKRREEAQKRCGCHKTFDQLNNKDEKEKDMEEFAQGTSLIAGSTLLLLMVLVGGLIALTVYAVGSVGKAAATDTEGTLNKVDRGLDTAQKAKNVFR